MIEMLKETGHYPAFVAWCIVGAIGLASPSNSTTAISND